MYYQNTTGFMSPTANIAVNRNRLKSYGEKIYVKSGTHFEIELFNPKTSKVLAMIYLDGVKISSAGIVIKPGQRVFLERWIDEPKKFLFETYEVDDSIEAKNAIRENGKVKVEFYDQSLPSNSTIMPTTWTYDPMSQPIYGGTTHNQIYFSSSIGGSSNIIGQTNPTISSSTSSAVNLTSFETGRAERGAGSDQGFKNDDSSYNSWTCNTVHMQILPESQKPVEVAEIRNYCTNCGTRHKKSSWKFCPNCGTPI
jgi:hypothetical protein